jgi:hypothetical protein
LQFPAREKTSTPKIFDYICQQDYFVQFNTCFFMLNK